MEGPWGGSVCVLGMNGEEVSGHMPGTHRYVCGRKGGVFITAGLEVEASFRKRVRVVEGEGRQPRQAEGDAQSLETVT